MYSVRHPARRYDREYIAYPISVFSLCLAGSICRCGSGWKHGGFCFFSFPAISMIPCPHPPSPPFPAGRGSLNVYFAGGFAPGTPALNRLRHLQTLPYRCPAGGLPGRSPTRPAFSFISFPHPPAPLPPPGKGESQSLFRRGLRPRHPCTESPTALADAAVQEPGGGLPGRSPADLAFSFISCPHPPRPPSPTREGGVSKFISPGGFAPGTPALNRLRHLQTLPYGNPAGGLPGRSPTRPALSFICGPHLPAPLPVGKGGSDY